MKLLDNYNNGRIPSERILKHAQHPCYAIMHFSMNTYTNKEWGFGDESPDIFNPVDFNAENIVKACKEGGLDGIILVCKHHDGFCLWPTKTTPHNISRSPWRNGKGDIVGEMAAACRAEGLKVGFYVSPWDRNSPAYGTPDYPEIFREQLREICSNYGEAFEIWFDGANGGDGFYGGARETRKIDAYVYYDWLQTWNLVRSLQPNAVIFSDVGPDVRWVGNEDGFADPDAYASYSPHSSVAGTEPAPGRTIGVEGTAGHADGNYFIPFECDFPLRPGWFYHPEQEGQQRSGARLLKNYLLSVGCGGFMNVGIAPDPSGKMTANDIKSLRDFKAFRDQLFSNPLKKQQLIIQNRSAVLEFGKPLSVNFLELQEDLTHGETVCGYTVEGYVSGKWQKLFGGNAIGLKRLKNFPRVMADALRITVMNTIGDHMPEWINVTVYDAPENLFDVTEMENLLQRKDYRKLENVEINGLQAECFFTEKMTLKGAIFSPVHPVSAGTPLHYDLAICSSDGEWHIVSQGEFSNIQANPIPQLLTFDPIEGTAIRLTARKCADPAAETLDMQELGILI